MGRTVFDQTRHDKLATGDNCSRAVIVGSLLAAQADDALLESFAAKTAGFPEVKQAVATLAAM